MDRVRILLAVRQPLVRNDLRLHLEQQSALEVVAEASKEQRVLKQVLHYRPDLLLLDIDFPDGSEIEVVSEVQSLVSLVKVIMLATNASLERILPILGAGAHGYVHMKAPTSYLVSAIHAVLGGILVLPQEFSRILTDSSPGSTLYDQHPLDRTAKCRRCVTDLLTRRELQVLNLIAGGSCTKEIAHLLTLSPRTVEFHVNNLCAKLGVNSRIQAVTAALKSGWIDLDSLNATNACGLLRNTPHTDGVRAKLEILRAGL